MGVAFYSPEDWEYVDNNKGSGVVIVGLKVPPKRYEIENVTFSIHYRINNDNLTPEQYGKRTFDALEYEENGKMTVGDREAYYFISGLDHPDTEKFTSIFVNANAMIYEITYGGDIKLYKEYYKTFEKILETVTFYTPTYIEELGGNVSSEIFMTQDNITNQKMKAIKDGFLGVWQFYDNTESNTPAFELIINSIENNTINFDLMIYRTYAFENQTATLYSNSDTSISYTYSIKLDNGEEMSGMIFLHPNDGIDFTVYSSDPESFESATIPFTIKSDTSLLK